MLGQQTPTQRKSLENLPSASASTGSPPQWSSPQGSSFSNFKDIEVPLGGTTELNDDAKEKSLRRRSLLDERAARRRSLLSMNNQGEEGENRRRSMNNNLNASSPNLASPGSSRLRPSGPSSLLGVVEPHQAPIPSLLKVSADSFEQWLKLATDNKINANNSWNFALIDYFHEMSLLREGDSINFQKASCTLDGCVKIYTSRVDSVATETTKLLGGLATSSKGREGEDADNADNDEEETDKPVKKKHSSRGGNTLAKDFASLSLDKFNLEFAVDPLFKKTCADFDEGGARGLLLNHLSVDVEGKIIFDAGDARDEGDDGDDDEDEDEEDEETPKSTQDDERQGEKSTKKRTDVEAAMIDIQRLRSKFLPSLNRIFEKDICPSLKDFQLSGTSEMDFAFLRRFHDDEDDEDDVEEKEARGSNEDSVMRVDSEMPMADDGFDDFDDDHDQGDFYSGQVGGDDDDMAVDKPVKEEVIEDAFGDLDEQIAAQRAGPQLDSNNLLENDDLLGKGSTDIYSYFDAALMRNWAGPEHWKLRRIPKDKNSAAAVTTIDGVPVEEGPKKRSAKEPLVINFLDAEEVDEDEIFAPAEASSLMFTASNEAENRKSKHVLPDDVHFSSKQLLRMFMKPSFIIKSKNRQQGYRPKGEEPESYNLTFPDEQFWASHTNNVDESDVGALTEQLDNTQIYNDYVEDDEDDYGFQDQGFYAPGAGMVGLGLLDGDGNDYASQLVSQPKRVKATYINFSKTAKKVDVKKLKDNIWKELTAQSLKRQPGAGDLDRQRNKKKANMDLDDEDGENENRDEEEQPNTEDEEDYIDYVKKEQKFTEVIGGLSKVYPEQKLREISVPFCFICLLHLANEKNLSIVGSEDLAELTIKQE
ncbi:hypothetical protein CPB97_010146 [Podila verticillata]|nr:hypothetical protein CPB97_010146 [Podila verticillata]